MVMRESLEGLLLLKRDSADSLVRPDTCVGIRQRQQKWLRQAKHVARVEAAVGNGPVHEEHELNMHARNVQPLGSGIDRES